MFGVWLEDSFGLQLGALAASAAVIGLSELGGESLTAALVDKLGKRRAVGIGIAANTLAALLLWLLGRSEWGALLGLFLFYLSFEFTMVSCLPLISAVAPGARATLMAATIMAFSLGRGPVRCWARSSTRWASGPTCWPPRGSMPPPFLRCKG